jgi:hypothetical protein
MDIRLSSGRSLRRSFVACLIVLGAFASTAASNASAAQWKVAGSPLTGSASYSSGAATGFNLSWEVGSSKIRLTASGVESLSSSIFNSNGLAAGQEILRLTGVKFVEPSTCVVQGGAISTVVLDSSLLNVNGITYEQMAPASGQGVAFTLTVSKGQGACALSGSYNVTGSFDAEVSGLGDERLTHELKFSHAIDGATKGGLRIFGTHPFEVAGSLVETLTGTHSGQTWSAL